jgi:hypothetical protein
MEVPKFKVIVPVLIVCLALSLVFNVYPFFNRNCEVPKARSFVFLEINQYLFAGVERYRKRILNSSELLRVETTFCWETSNFTVTAKINDDDYHDLDYMGLAFDADRDNYFESIYLLLAYNATIDKSYAVDLTVEGGIRWLKTLAPHPSSWHYCVFNSSGYYFYFSISKEAINFQQPMPVHLCFIDYNAWYPFCNLEEITAYWEFEV